MTTSADDQESVLREWATSLASGLGLDGLRVDIDAILAIAGSAAHAVVRPAAPLTTYLVGYAAGVAAAGGSSPDAAFEQAAAAATALAAERTEPDAS
jgi:multisubunit Na+/H+ antiporter MnhB subunit